MRQVGLLAAAGSYALDQHVARLARRPRAGATPGRRLAGRSMASRSRSPIPTSCLSTWWGMPGHVPADFLPYLKAMACWPRASIGLRFRDASGCRCSRYRPCDCDGARLLRAILIRATRSADSSFATCLPVSINSGLFIMAGLLLNLTPGPDVLYIVSNGVRGGGAGNGGGAGHHGRLFCAHSGGSSRGQRADRRVCHGVHGAEMAGGRVPGVRGEPLVALPPPICYQIGSCWCMFDGGWRPV
jgi:hypothetical protein